MFKLKDFFIDYSEKNSNSGLSKTVYYLIGNKLNDIKKILDGVKVSRDDVSEYKIKVLQRQQIVNEKLVTWGGIKEDENVLDACCGPEGSSLAVLNKKANWFGNEISIKTYEHLLGMGLNVKNGSAENLPYEDNSFDYTIYCYAINNIQATFKTILDSKRVLKESGSILIADPGITKWLSDIILYSIKDNINTSKIDIKSILDSSNRFNIKIPEYFKGKDISLEDYSNLLFSGLLGTDKKGLIFKLFNIEDYLLKRYSKKKINANRISNHVHKIINALYWENIIITSKSLGLKLEKLSFYNCVKYNGNSDWEFTSNIDITDKGSSPDLKQEFMKLELPNQEHSKDLLIGEKNMNIEKLLPTVMIKLSK